MALETEFLGRANLVHLFRVTRRVAELLQRVSFRFPRNWATAVGFLLEDRGEPRLVET